MQSLRDKLLQAGLVSEDQAKKSAADEATKPPPRAPSQAPRSHGGGPRHGSGPSASPSAPRHVERREAPPPRHHSSGPMITARPQTLTAARSIPKLPPMPGSKEAQRIDSRKQTELERTLRELVSTTQVAVEHGETVFYFVTRKQKLRRLELTPAQAQQLEKGELAVVERQEPAQIEHSLVPPETAEKMLALLPKSVRFFNRGTAPVGFLTDDELALKKEHEASEGTGPAEAVPVPPATSGET